MVFQTFTLIQKLYKDASLNSYYFSYIPFIKYSDGEQIKMIKANRVRSQNEVGVKRLSKL